MAPAAVTPPHLLPKHGQAVQNRCTSLDSAQCRIQAHRNDLQMFCDPQGRIHVMTEVSGLTSLDNHEALA